MRIRTLLIAVITALGATLSPIPSAQAEEPTWRLAVAPAEWQTLQQSAAQATVRVDVFRMGYYDGVGARLVAQSAPQPSVRQPACATRDKMVDCSGWGVTHRFDTTAWEPGAYLAKLTDDRGNERYVAAFLRSRSHAGSVTVMFATSTHAAYNNTGGYSLYTGLPDGSSLNRAHTVSLHRPDRGNGADKFYRYELGLVQYLDSLGVPVSYTTNSELHRGADAFRGSRALVVLGHDEYWSVEMRRNAELLRDRGTNLLVLGANTAYYRTRFNADFTEVTSYKLSHLDPVQDRTTTGTFRAEPFPNPEARLLGSQYD